jgi:uncharacterized protein YlzI (FlbEa/FlbD family)
MRRLARSRARDPEIAQDALQETYCVLARYVLAPHVNPEKIENLRAYFATTLIREIYRLLNPRKATVSGSVEEVIDAGRGNACGQQLPGPFDQTVCAQLVAKNGVKSLVARRGHFTRQVAGRSPDPDRYRRLIVTVAERVLIAIAVGGISDADSNPAMRAEYPEWFAEEGCETANAHQRLKRARDDMQDLLQHIVGISRDDLYS